MENKKTFTNGSDDAHECVRKEEKMETEEKDLSTSKVLSRIRSARSSDGALSWHREAGEPVFSELLFRLMEEQGLKAKEVIRSCRMERSYFYHILSGKKIPSRNMTIRIGLCIRADLQDINRLLRLAGAAGLYPKLKRDALLIYAIQRQLSMEQTNLLLLEHDEIPLYRDEKSR